MATQQFLATSTTQNFDSDPGIAAYRVGLHDAAGAEVAHQLFPGTGNPAASGFPTAPITFDVPSGTGWTVRGSQINGAGALVGAVVESAPFDVSVVTRVVIGAITMIVP